MTGSGTAADPYVIWDVDDLQDMDLDLGAYYILGGNINATLTSGWNGGLGFDPIGQGVPYFQGTFDGKDYTINDLTINRPLEDNVGLFGVTDDGAEITNVILANVSITGNDYVGALIGTDVAVTLILNNCSSSGTVDGDVYVGGLLGWVWDPVIRGSFSSAVVGGDRNVGGFAGRFHDMESLEACYATGDVTANFGHVGGFVGHFTTGAIARSFATGNVIAGDEWAGGFVGWSNGESTDCFARGSVTSTADQVGGFAGISGNETNCYSTGAVSGVGGNIGGYSSDGGPYSDCFWDTETSGTAISDGGTGKTTAQLKDIVTIQAAGWAISTIWNVSSTCVGGYPCLIGVNPCCPSFPVVDETIEEPKVALEAIRNLEIVYGGRFFIDKSGNAVYQSRYNRNG